MTAVTHPFYELVLGGVLLSPFVTYAALALVAMVILRPFLHLARFTKLFSHPSIVELSLYVIILGVFTILF